MTRMSRFLLMFIFLLIEQISASYHNISQPLSVAATRQYQRHPKRWYGVNGSKPGVPPREQGGGFGTWPADSHGRHALRYCFEDARSHKNLGPVLEEAIHRWGAATISAEASSLRIELNNQNKPVCDKNDRADDDALHIKDDTKDEADEDTPDAQHWNTYECSSQTTVGYNYHGGHNVLMFCELTPDDPASRAEAPIYMMHELGHAMGLAHEHQRPDRDKYLTYNCHNIKGWNEKKMKRLITDDDEELFGGPPAKAALEEQEKIIKERLNLVCQTEEGAHSYFPRALEYIRGNYMIESDERWREYARSTSFDYDSIMIYSSNAVSKADKGDKKDRWVISKKDGSPVWMGGKKDGSGGISRGDIARIAQLYPLYDDGNVKAQDLEQWPPTKEIDEFSPALGET